MARQRFSFEWLSVHIPSCLYQDKNYYHEGGFADDKYRRPWTKVSVDSTLIMVNFSVLDHWKACLCIEDFLEKKPISSTFIQIDNEDIEVVPSSNGSAEFSIEEVYLLMKNNKEKSTAANHLQLTYAPEVLKEQEEDLCIKEELIFIENLAKYSKWVPNLHKLLSRLSLFQVQDPLLNSKGDRIREEEIFRECFNFSKSMESEEKQKEPHEDFCKMILINEEPLVLPLKLQSDKTADLISNPEIPTCSALKLLLQVTPEAIPSESEDYKITNKDFKANITSDTEISQYCPIHPVSAKSSSSVEEFRKTASHGGELELPLTPISRSENVHVNSLYADLHSEPISPLTKSILIMKSSKEYMEGLVWHSERYQHPMNSLLLAEHQTFVPTCQQFPITELKKQLSVHEDISVLSPQEDHGWINLRKNLASPCVLETLSPLDLGGEKSLFGPNVEEFSKIGNFQLQELYDEKYITKNKVESTSGLDFGDRKDSCPSFQQKDTFSQESLRTTSGVLLHGTKTSCEKFAKKDKLQNETETLLFLKNQEEEKNYQPETTGWEKVSTEANNSSGNKKASSLELLRKQRDDFDLLSNFIMLRSKHVIDLTEETSNVDIQEAVPDIKKESPAFKNLSSIVATVVTESPTKADEDTVTIQIKPSESQFQAYHILEATVAPVLKELGMHSWKFATLRFDDTRFFLKQQEKMLSDTFKQGVTSEDIKDAKDIAIFKQAATLHLLITVRDLLLTCSLNAALGYLSKAKDRYKDFLGSSMDNIWRQLNIVQFAMQREHETNPKIAELQHQIFKWVQKNTNEQGKVVIVTGMDFDEEIAAFIKTIGMVQGLKAVHLNSDKKGSLLESKIVINSLKKCSCVIVRNQHIGPDFPWNHFSLVVDYNCSGNSFWTDVCRKLNVSYISFVTTVPETLGTENISPDNFERALLEVKIPYVFLTSEGLLSTPEILQLLESKYNITFIERSCCEALQFFGSTDRYVVMTLDECTAVIMQNIEELSYEKSSDYLVLRLMVLSLQYSCCWIVLYSRERLNSEYSLAGKALHQLALVYAALVAFAQKSDFEVKVALTPGVEETALLIRQIADYILMTSKRHPQEWLDKSWLSVLPSEGEKCLLTFPCMNPLVAQVMLKKSPSLEWLLTSTLDQLQKLLPEVPEKVLKHFSDITSLYTLNSPSEFKPLEKTEPFQDSMNSTSFSEALLSSSQELNRFNEYTRYFNNVQNSKNISPGYYQNESWALLKPNARQDFMAPSLFYQEGLYPFQEKNQRIGSSVIPEEEQQYIQFLKSLETEQRVNSPLQTQNNFCGPTHINFEAKIPSFGLSPGDANDYLENGLQKGICRSKVINDQKLYVPVLMKNPIHQNSQNLLGVPKQLPVKQHNSNQDSKHSWYLMTNRKTFPFQQSSCNFLGEFENTTYSSPGYQFEESYPPVQKIDFSPHDRSFCKESHPDRFLQISGECIGKKRPNLLSSNLRECNDSAADLELTQILDLKKRRLTYEKDPGRTDGQTRLKFF